jgi:glycosyltransferase 2 family protein
MPSGRSSRTCACMTGQQGTGGIEHAISRRLARTGLLLGAFVALVVVAVVAAGWDDAVAAARALGPERMAALCALAAAHYLLRAWRWHLIVQAAGLGTHWWQNARHFFGGFALTATPGRVGELVRLRWLRRETRQGFGRVLPIALADRAIELAAIVLVIVLALSVAGLGSAAVWWLVAVASVLVWVACRPRLLDAVIVATWRMAGRRRSRLFVRLRRVARRLAPFMRMRVLAPTMVIGVVGWALEGLAFWLLLDWLGATVSLAAAAAIFLVAVLSGALSGLPGGLGGTEATAVALLLLQGVAPETAILATAIIRIATLWFAVAIGLCVFPAAESRSTAVPA